MRSVHAYAARRLAPAVVAAVALVVVPGANADGLLGGSGPVSSAVDTLLGTAPAASGSAAPAAGSATPAASGSAPALDLTPSGAAVQVGGVGIGVGASGSGITAHAGVGSGSGTGTGNGNGSVLDAGIALGAAGAELEADANLPPVAGAEVRATVPPRALLEVSATVKPSDPAPPRGSNGPSRTRPPADVTTPGPKRSPSAPSRQTRSGGPPAAMDTPAAATTPVTEAEPVVQGRASARPAALHTTRSRSGTADTLPPAALRAATPDATPSRTAAAQPPVASARHIDAYVPAHASPSPADRATHFQLPPLDERALRIVLLLFAALPGGVLLLTALAGRITAAGGTARSVVDTRIAIVGVAVAMWIGLVLAELLNRV
jgi:hypothetical protein